MTAARLVLDVPFADADVVSGRLWGLGTNGVEEQDGPMLTRLLAGFESVEDAERARDHLALGTVEPVTSDEWLDQWREYAAVSRAGRRFVIHPIWLERPHGPGPSEVVLSIDPGHAFGSGSHPTTKLVLGLLEPLVEGGESVLDVGCGSGLLAIGAARIGATDVVAIDTDPEAVRVCRANAVRNGVDHMIAISQTPLSDLVTPFHIVMANILAPVLIDLADHLVRLCEPSGRVVLSGLLDTQVDGVVEALAPLVVKDREDDDGWSALVLGHR